MLKSCKKENMLVTLHPGKYWKVKTCSHSPEPGVEIKAPTNALLLEFQGCHKDESECWHALVDGQIILVWESNFSKGS